MIAATILVSSLVYWLLESLDPESDLRQDRLGGMETTWMLATAFAGQFEFDPQTGPARLFTFSIAFWALLMGAAYTANLASFLVIRNQPGIRIDSIDQAVRLNMNMCVWRSSQTDTRVSNKFAAFASSGRLIRKNDQRGVYEGLRNGECDIAITEVSTWEIFQYDEEINGDCSLNWIGRPFVNIPASFAIKSDAGALCTSLLRDVFNLHLHEMENDGTIQALWDTYNEQTASVFCSAGGGEDEEEGSGERRLTADGRSLKAAQNAAAEGGGSDGFDDTTKLTLSNMGGVFVLHVILSGLSLLFALVPWVRSRMRKARESKEKKTRNRDAAGATEHPSSSLPVLAGDSISAAGSSLREDGPDDMFYFDAMMSKHHDPLMEELRTEMNAKLNRMEDQLTALLQILDKKGQ